MSNCSLIKELYLRLVKGYIKTDKSGLAITKLFNLSDQNMIDIVKINSNSYLINLPKKMG